MNATRCGIFWAENPLILAYGWKDFFPFSDAARRCTATALNSFTRFGIYLGVLLALIYRSSAYLGIALGFAIIAVAAFYGMQSQGKLREGFETIVAPSFTPTPGQPRTNLVGGEAAADAVVEDVIGASDRTHPTAANPFMNILVNEVLDNPKKPAAATVDTNAMARQSFDTGYAYFVNMIEHLKSGNPFTAKKRMETFAAANKDMADWTKAAVAKWDKLASDYGVTLIDYENEAIEIALMADAAMYDILRYVGNKWDSSEADKLIKKVRDKFEVSDQEYESWKVARKLN